MDKRTYNLVVGVVLLIASLVFFALPAFLRLDALFPIILALVCFVAALVLLLTGSDE